MTKESASIRISAAIREDIFRGQLLSGTSLIETELTEKYKVSRNTLREAFQLLHMQGLVTQERNKSVRIRRMTLADMKDIFVVRRLLELSALDRQEGITTEWLDKMRQLIACEEKAVASSQAKSIGTYSLIFHQHIVTLHKSERIDQMFSTIIPQLRLIFISGPLELSFQTQWVKREFEIWQLLSTNQFDKAKQALSDYLDDSEKYLITSSIDDEQPLESLLMEVNYGL